MGKESKEVVRHLVATIAYRLAKSVHQVDAAFYALESANGIRRPMEILRHMSQVISYTIAVLQGTSTDKLPQLDGTAELERFYRLLKQADQLIAETDLDDTLTLKLIQGPLADTLTHIGQIALLRRAFNDPVKGENFMKAKVRVGLIDREAQELSNDLFE